MNETSLKALKTKKDWQLDSGSFHRLLVYLDEDANTYGLSYVKMRERLVAYFDRKNCLTPDDLADETLTSYHLRRTWFRGLGMSECGNWQLVYSLNPFH